MGCFRVLQLKCCGMTGGLTSNTSWAIYKLQSKWFKDQTGPGEFSFDFSCLQSSSFLYKVTHVMKNDELCFAHRD